MNLHGLMVTGGASLSAADAVPIWAGIIQVMDFSSDLSPAELQDSKKDFT